MSEEAPEITEKRRKWQAFVKTGERVESLIEGFRKEDPADPAGKADKYGQTLLFFACQRKPDHEALQLCQFLASHFGISPLVSDSWRKQTALFFAARDGNAMVCKWLVEKGCNPDHRDSEMQSPLFYAACRNQSSIISLLVGLGARPDLRDKNKQTSLFFAASHGCGEALETLLKLGADPTLVDIWSKKPAVWARERGYTHLEQSLREAGKKKREVESSTPHLFRKLYRLEVTNPNGTKRLAGEEDIKRFWDKYPAIAERLWRKDDSIFTPPGMDESSLQGGYSEGMEGRSTKNWRGSALRILNDVMRTPDAEAFCSPVDWKKLGLFDYPSIIPEPMDFGTVRENLQRSQRAFNEAVKSEIFSDLPVEERQRVSLVKADSLYSYRRFREDCQLIRDNCLKYNGPQHVISIKCQRVFKAFLENCDLAFHDLDKRRSWEEAPTPVESVSSERGYKKTYADGVGWTPNESFNNGGLEIQDETLPRERSGAAFLGVAGGEYMEKGDLSDGQNSSEFFGDESGEPSIEDSE